MWTVVAILALTQLITIAATLRLWWWAKIVARLHMPVRFASTSGLQAAWQLLESKVPEGEDLKTEAGKMKAEVGSVC